MFRHFAAFFLSKSCYKRKSEFSVDVHSPDIVLDEKYFNVNILKFMGKVESVNFLCSQSFWGKRDDSSPKFMWCLCQYTCRLHSSWDDILLGRNTTASNFRVRIIVLRVLWKLVRRKWLCIHGFGQVLYKSIKMLNVFITDIVVALLIVFNFFHIVIFRRSKISYYENESQYFYIYFIL